MAVLSFDDFQKWLEAYGAGDSQKDVQFTHRAVATTEGRGLAHWRASFVRLRSGNRVELDGLFMAEFDADGKCVIFRDNCAHVPAEHSAVGRSQNCMKTMQ